MSNVNYIKHLKATFQQFTKDNRLNPTHISLYLALFHLWNNNRFVDEFFVCRDELMEYSKIGSKSTYHKCIKELSHWKYIIYFPSHNPFKGSKIKMFDFGTSTGQVVDSHRTKIETSTGQALVSIYKHNKHIKQYKQENENLDFLKVKKDKNYNQPL